MNSICWVPLHTRCLHSTWEVDVTLFPMCRLDKRGYLWITNTGHGWDSELRYVISLLYWCLLIFLGLGLPGATACWGWHTSSVRASIFAHLLWVTFTAWILSAWIGPIHMPELTKHLNSKHQWKIREMVSGLSGVFLSGSEEAERGPWRWPLAHTLERVTGVMLQKVDLHLLQDTLHWGSALRPNTRLGHSASLLQFAWSMIDSSPDGDGDRISLRLNFPQG